jgi:hypothetical protein
MKRRSGRVLVVKFGQYMRYLVTVVGDVGAKKDRPRKWPPPEPHAPVKVGLKVV